jgi:protein tyrosine phosphatase
VITEPYVPQTTTAKPRGSKKTVEQKQESKWATPLLVILLIIVIMIVVVAYLAMERPELLSSCMAYFTCIAWLTGDGAKSGGAALKSVNEPQAPRAPKVAPKPPSDLVLADCFLSAKKPSNADKNRYRDILPYEATRVKLTCDPKDEEASDYINANFVAGVDHNIPYICTQGPVESTIPDFWRMVWEQQVSTISMMTKFVEKNKEKVFQYFPELIGEDAVFGGYQVTLRAEVAEEKFMVRRIDVVELATGITRVIRHAQYTAWPDHGAPAETESMLTFRRVVRQCHEDAHGVMLVHCSAGVGRAGSFICVDQALDLFSANGSVDIHAKVVSVRRCRPHLVQAAAQYVFIHKAILDAVTSEPPVAAAGLDAATIDFVSRYFTPDVMDSFDLGRGGRNILHVGAVSRCDANWANAKDSMLALTTDLLLMCDITPNGYYRLAVVPLSRAKLSVEPSDPSNESASFVIEVEGSKPGKTSKMLCVAASGEAKREWEAKLNNRSSFLPTESMRGPRIVGFPTPSRTEALSLLGCPDPYTEEGAIELQREWDSIPKILDADATLIPDINSYPGVSQVQADGSRPLNVVGLGQSPEHGAKQHNPLFGAEVDGGAPGWMEESDTDAAVAAFPVPGAAGLFTPARQLYPPPSPGVDQAAALQAQFQFQQQLQQDAMMAQMSGAFPGFGPEAPIGYTPLKPLIGGAGPYNGGIGQPQVSSPGLFVTSEHEPPMRQTTDLNTQMHGGARLNDSSMSLFPPASPAGMHNNRFSTTDLSGAFNPAAHNMPNMRSLRGRAGQSMRGMANIGAPPTERRDSTMSVLAEPAELSGITEETPGTPVGPNSPDHEFRVMPAMEAAAGGPLSRADLALQLLPGTPSDPRAAVLAPMPNTPSDPRLAFMASLVSPAIFNTPDGRPASMLDVEPWTQPEIYDFDDGLNPRTRPGTPTDYDVNHEIVPEEEPAAPATPTVMEEKRPGESLQDRWKRAAKRASIVAKMTSLINTPVKMDAPFGIVGKAASRFNTGPGGQLRAKTLSVNDQSVDEPLTFKVTKRHRPQKVEPESANSLGDDECTHLGNCTCPDCR